MTFTSVQELNLAIIQCQRCPRLIEYCREVARVKRRAYRNEAYWGRPLPGWGDPQARVLMVGLAPGAHGANRTGRMFTGDGSGDFLTPALHRAGFANQPTSTHRGDGLELRGLYVAAAAHCAPPDNKPTPAEIANCRPYLVQHLALLPNVSVILCLGKIGFDAVLAALAERGVALPRPRPVFGHLAEHQVGPYAILCSYHPSRQNTQTGRLTAAMFDAVFERVNEMTNDAAQALIGHWSLDPEDRAAREAYGDLKVEFTADGRLVYSLVDRGKLQLKVLTYRVEGDRLITGRPGDPKPQRSRFALTPDGKLELSTDGTVSRYVRATGI